MSGCRIDLPYRVEYVHAAWPCWLCDRCLQLSKNGTYRAVVVFADGADRLCHQICAELEWPAHESVHPEVAADIGERHIQRFRPDQEVEGWEE